MIIESIITTLGADGTPHLAPMGVILEEGGLEEGGPEGEERPILAPFRPSATLENLTRSGSAVINHVDDVRIFAGCLTGRRDWPSFPARKIAGIVLKAALAHQEISVERVEEDALRPRFHCRILHAESHGAFRGFNRAQAAVIEAAILASRLHMLPREKVDSELAYLGIAIAKTAGPRELEAWNWLLERIGKESAS